ncbi:histidine-rich metal-binding polypeptide domain protein [Oesophagostomum dentatum]|uniref:Histidine-rich metal-binding polypeptide domain protein n=1 Tax=Oesophagostomum dentatum TaxID=61180 RepID=A0A0B1S4A8_OESDE|nr:histidine-rich metal-binding polypeptide domain protein [Oesophagostomum dentatum]
MVIEVLSPHILGGAHSHEEAFHEVSEFGSHSPHHHGDEAHEREEGTHHEHELGEGELEGIPSTSSKSELWA